MIKHAKIVARNGQTSEKPANQRAFSIFCMFLNGLLRGKLEAN